MKSDIKRLSMSAIHDESPSGSQESLSTPQQQTPLLPNKDDSMKNQIANLLKKNTISNKDVVSLISQVVNLLLEQKNEIQVALQGFLEAQRVKDDRIDALEKEVSELRNNIQSFKNREPSVALSEGSPSDLQASTKQFDPFNEINERYSRSKNIIIFNINESQSLSPEERSDHDKTHVVQTLQKLELDGNVDFKVVRIGRPSSKPRPVKVIFADPSMVTKCLQNKRKLAGCRLSVKPDLTLMQRNKIKMVFDELNKRKADGESDLTVRYRDGNPYIAKTRSQNRSSNESSKND